MKINGQKVDQKLLDTIGKLDKEESKINGMNKNN
jgi:hypothetical protein